MSLVRQVQCTAGSYSAAANATTWRDAYNTQIARIRAAGVNCMIAIDAGGYGQDIRTIKNYGAAVESADAIIGEETEAFEKWVAQSRVGPMIEQLFSDVRALAQIEVRATLKKCPDLTDRQRQILEAPNARYASRNM